MTRRARAPVGDTAGLSSSIVSSTAVDPPENRKTVPTTSVAASVVSGTDPGGVEDVTGVVVDVGDASELREFPTVDGVVSAEAPPQANSENGNHVERIPAKPPKTAAIAGSGVVAGCQRRA